MRPALYNSTTMSAQLDPGTEPRMLTGDQLHDDELLRIAWDWPLNTADSARTTALLFDLTRKKRGPQRECSDLQRKPHKSQPRWPRLPQEILAGRRTQKVHTIAAVVGAVFTPNRNHCGASARLFQASAPLSSRGVQKGQSLAQIESPGLKFWRFLNGYDLMASRDMSLLRTTTDSPKY